MRRSVSSEAAAEARLNAAMGKDRQRRISRPSSRRNGRDFRAGWIAVPNLTGRTVRAVIEEC